MTKSISCVVGFIVLRSMQCASPLWRSSVSDALSRSILSVEPFVSSSVSAGDSKSERCRLAVASAAAAFCVLGADAEVLRSGGRFALANSDQVCDVIHTCGCLVRSLFHVHL